MDADGLPIIGPGIDFTKVEAIHQKRTLAFLNHFITHTAQFMNRFSCNCEEKLSNLSVKIQRLETSMSILEAKLSSIPGLDNITVGKATETAATALTKQTETVQEVAAENITTMKQEEEVHEKPTPQASVITVAEDPAYAKFVKMLKLGVPEAAIKMKMQMEGLNPDLLDTPDAPAPSSTPASKDDIEFSDEEAKSESEESSSDAFSD